MVMLIILMRMEIIYKINNILQILNKFQQTNPNIYIGGSVSLILQDVIPERIPKDIDIISPTRIHINEIFDINKPKIVRSYKFEGLKFELFNNPNAQYIEYNKNGIKLKLSPIDEIMEWKLKKQNIDNPKHNNDLKYYLKNSW